MCFSKVGVYRFQLSVELISPNDVTPISIIFYYYDWGLRHFGSNPAPVPLGPVRRHLP